MGVGGQIVNRTAEAEALLAHIVAWCTRTGAPETQVGSILFRHPGFVGLLRKRLIVTADTERKVMEFLALHPDGYTSPPLSMKNAFSSLPPMHILQGCNQNHRELPFEQMVRIREEISSQTRAPVFPRPAPLEIPPEVYAARRQDGRPLSEFITALIEMGLSCWRENQIEEA